MKFLSDTGNLCDRELALDILYKIKYNPCIQSTLILAEKRR